MPFRIRFTATPFKQVQQTCIQRGAVYLYRALNPLSFGHLIRDNFGTITTNMEALDLEGAPFELLIMKPGMTDVMKHYAPTVANRASEWEERIGCCPLRYILFRQIVVGHGGLDLHPAKNPKNICAGQRFVLQRRQAYHLLGVSLRSARDYSTPRVLLLDKYIDDKRRIANIHELAVFLKAQLPMADVRSHTLRDLDSREQIEYLSQTSVLISTIGSPPLRMVYMPTDAQVILIGSTKIFKDATSCWEHLPYLHMHYYATNTSESVLRYQRAGTGSTTLKDADVVPDRNRLLEIVRVALKNLQKD